MDSSRFGPRDAAAAQRSAAVLVMVAALALGGTTAVVHVVERPAGTPLVVVVGVLLVALSAVLWTWVGRTPEWFLLVLTVAMVATVLTLNLMTGDAGGGAQVAFLYPVVYAGAFLRPWAAWTVAATATVAETITVFTVLPPARAGSDQGFVLVAIVTLTYLLASAARRHDALAAQLDALASADPLTGLATRRALEDAVRFAIADEQHAHRPAVPSEGMGLVLADIDHFKELNEAYGHPAGDAVLVHTARVLTDAVRPGDTVARLGGDELAILLPGVGLEAVTQRAEALRRAVRDTPLDWEGQVVHVTVSMGVSHTPTSSQDLDGLYAAADAAMYTAKRQGRNRVVTAGARDPDADRVDPAERADLPVRGTPEAPAGLLRAMERLPATKGPAASSPRLIG